MVGVVGEITGQERERSSSRSRTKKDAATVIFSSMACRLFRIFSKGFKNPDAEDDDDDLLLVVVVSHVVGVVYVGEITMNKMSVKEQVQQQEGYIYPPRYQQYREFPSPYPDSSASSPDHYHHYYRYHTPL